MQFPDETRTLSSCLTLSLLCLIDQIGSARYALLSNYHNYTDAEKMCRGLGFDGLAVVSTPEEYHYVKNISEELRQSYGLWIGMRFDPDRATLVWDDGSVPASDMPWHISPDMPNLISRCGRMHNTGPVGMYQCDVLRYAVCGNHSQLPKEAMGSTYSGEKPVSVTSCIAETKVESYLECAILCAAYLCRATHFDLVSKTCKVLGPNSFSGLNKSEGSVTFLRMSFL